jgi:hypothetical protein
VAGNRFSWMVVGLGLVAVVGVAACSASSPGPRPDQTAAPSTTAAAAPTATTSTSPSPGTPSASPTGPGGVQNLLVSSADRSELTAAFAAFKGIPLSDVYGASPLPGSVYYAYDPATGTYWALANFGPSKKASLQVQVSMQDGGDIGMFRKVGSGPWQTSTGGAPPLCGYLEFFPQAVLTAWAMPTSPPTGLTC